jgi:hypothetical protein
MAYVRYGFFRVSGTVEHPIYFGNMCLVILGMMAVLARTSGMKLRSPLVALALFSAVGCVITSISFTPYVGMVAGTVFLLILASVRMARKALVPLVLMVITGMFAFTYQAAHTKLGEKPEGELPASFWIRKMIVTESWRKAVTAGAFGYGRVLDFSEDEEFDLASVDNSYMLFTMTRGWVYTTLWISIAFFFAIRMTSGFNHATSRSQIFPLAIATATVLGLMVSMYTVWAGGLYRVVWAIMLGLTCTLIDQVTDPEYEPRVRVARRGVPPQQVSVSPARPGGTPVVGGVPSMARTGGVPGRGVAGGGPRLSQG